MSARRKRRRMGCGKSQHRSPEDSEIDVKNANNKGKNSNSRSSSKTSTSSAGAGKASTGHYGPRRNSFGKEVRKCLEKEAEKEGKQSPLKKQSNGRFSKKLERNDEIGVPLGTGRTSKGVGAGDRSNGAMQFVKAQSLEVPNETHKFEASAKATCKDFKNITSNKTVHVTSSQVEFFRMLDEKIEQGYEYMTSGEISEVSSIDEAPEMLIDQYR